MYARLIYVYFFGYSTYIHTYIYPFKKQSTNMYNVERFSMAFIIHTHTVYISKMKRPSFPLTRLIFQSMVDFALFSSLLFIIITSKFRQIKKWNLYIYPYVLTVIGFSVAIHSITHSLHTLKLL